MLVVDASIACKWYLDEPGSDLARSVVDGRHELVAPDILLAEVGNALWRCHLRGEIAERDGAAALQGLAHMFHALVPSVSVIADAFQAAAVLRHPVYDCIYLIVARDLGVQLITADRRLIAVVRGSPWQGLVVPLDVAGISPPPSSPPGAPSR